MNRFDFVQTPLKGVYIIKPQPIKDERGYFERYFCANDFAQIGLCKPIVQINHSVTKLKGSLRGLHFQNPPFMETKIVRCLRGEVYDVAVDLRADSQTFLQYFGTTLSEDNGAYLYIPEGFAHGFQTLSDNVEMLYLTTQAFEPNADRSINPLDKRINIPWPLEVSNISQKDKNAPMLAEHFHGINIV